MPTHTGRNAERATQGRRGPRADLVRPEVASAALADGLKFLKEQWKWNGSKIARVLHLSPTTVNAWLRNEEVPVSGATLSPEIEAVVHLIAIHRSLGAMFADPFHQREWLHTEHPDLGISPEEKMSQSMAELISLRQYLDYARGRGA